ncbi:MAG: DUF371 domain-containing protein [Candidatus Hecatellales archaeon]|nr:MAG: DUF371 domain-containing protein [Candidatus Hecatellales archaeon]
MLRYMRVVEDFFAFGHKLIKATHPTTLEITRETKLTERGDCIVAVASSKGALDLNENFKKIAKSRDTRITLILRVNGLVEVVNGFGSPNLTFTHPTDLVVRKSEYTCPRTVMVKADKAAINLSRKFVSKIKNPKTKIFVRLVAEKV